MSTSIPMPGAPGTMLPPVAVPPSDDSTSTPEPSTWTPDVLISLIRNYGYAPNTGIARRQQRALTLLTQGHVTPLDLTMTAGGCPVALRYRVQSEAGEGHYYVTRTPNETTHVYGCTCPDTWQPCKHSYAAALYQTALDLAHAQRGALPSYHAIRASLPDNPILGAHELTALHVLLDTATRYDEIAREAARQYYGATVSYQSQCFSRLIDQVRWCHGTGYVGWSDGDVGTLHSVAGTHVIYVHWHAEDVRWYVTGPTGQEDRVRMRRILDAALPHWLQVALTSEADLPPPHSFESEEDPDGHYPVR